MVCKICDPKCKYNDCICNENFTEFYNIYNYISNISNVDDISLVKKWSISTMTVCCSFNCSIDIQKYSEIYIQDNKKVSFYNCINTYIGTKYQNKNKVSIKIFTNGNIQIAGILNITAAAYVIRKIFNRLLNIQAFISSGNAPFISNVRICMINSDFKIDKNIKQSLFCKCIEENEYEFIKRYTFNPSKYPGINVKTNTSSLDKFITCAVFRPGSIIITGGNNLVEYKNTFENILLILKNNKHILY